MSLRHKIGLASAGLAALLTGALTGVFLWTQQEVLRRELVIRGRILAEGSAQSLAIGLKLGDEERIEAVLASIRHQPDVAEVVLLRRRTGPTAQTDARSGLAGGVDRSIREFERAVGDAPPARDAALRVGAACPAEGGMLIPLHAAIIADVPDPATGAGAPPPGGAGARSRLRTLGTLHVVLSTARTDAVLRTALWAALGVGALTLAAGLGGVLLLVRWLTRPLRDLARGARQIAEGDLSARVRIPGGDELAELGVAFDAMAERLEALVGAQARLAAIVESSNDAIIGKTLDGVVLSWNQGAEMIYGYPASAMVGKSVTVLYPSDGTGELGVILDRIRRGERVPPYETVQVGRAGRRIDVSKSVSPIRDAAGRIVGASAIARDITERKRTEAELARVHRELEERAGQLARSNAELEQFAYVASHDLQEPLRMVTGYVQLLERRYRGRLDAAADDYIRYAVEGAVRMQALIQDLLAYSRVGAPGGAPERVDGREAFELAVANLRATLVEAGAEVSGNGLPAVLADQGQLVQVLQNLIANGVKFRGPEPPRIRVSAERRGAEWVWSVRDNGVGIDPAFQDRLFVLFHRLHGKEVPGTGIGLALCRKIIERHGGRIWVESGAGRGATFRFTLRDAEGLAAK